MADVTMTDEAAQAELAAIVDDLGVDMPDERDARPILRALKSGRLDFDTAEQAFTVELQKPITLDNGQTIDVLTLQEPTADQIRKANKINDPVELAVRLIGYATGQPEGYIGRIRQRDLNLLGALVGFFG